MVSIKSSSFCFEGKWPETRKRRKFGFCLQKNDESSGFIAQEPDPLYLQIF